MKKMFLCVLIYATTASICGIIGESGTEAVISSAGALVTVNQHTNGLLLTACYWDSIILYARK